MQEALRRLEAALVHYEQPAAADGGSDPAHGALSRAVQLMREEAQALRIALDEL